ncbi:exodeoxyribonuclease V subunit gamma [Marinobacter sp.]|uniref:exodeoxyribonuclease V subunit gamma n=1 Tax=Marinobacter sp. TaxID=50741 RepID=UPI00384E5D89
MAAGLSSAGKSSQLPTGLQVIHANRLEDLRALTVEIIRRLPLAPLEDEVFLVHSNGIAQWLKLALARDEDDPELAGVGIAAGMTFSLPSRFLWEAYRATLGEDAVAKQSPWDKDRLTWRLLRLLPKIRHEPVFAPLGRFLEGEEPDRRLYQLAERIADLFDQYQVYRADWLDGWRQRLDTISIRDETTPLPDDQLWQPELWRRLDADIGQRQEVASRAAVHTRFMAETAGLGPDTRPEQLPRRVIVFGVSSLPQQTLEVLSRLGQFAQVLLCVHNPCQFYWADIVEDRDLLRAISRRGRTREGMPANLDESNLHLHAQPLLAAWGKQGRDYIRLLDEYDDQAAYAHWFDRIDLFESPAENPAKALILHSLQDDILNLRPVREAALPQPSDYQGDDSLVFHSAHSPQREVEILHDQLLAAFSQDKSLKPQDVIVMVPDINAYAPHIQAVFGQLDPADDRFIPYTISDQGQRHQVPVLVALEKLLSLPESRLAVSDVLDLLDVPEVRERFSLTENDLPQLHDWIEGANIRWGLNAEQRMTLDLPDGLSQNTWLFGLRRMLLGYATGDGESWQGIQPYGEVGGLESRLAGQLHDLVRMLEAHWRMLSERRTPGDWVRLLNRVRADFFANPDEEGSLTFSRLDQVVGNWLDACEGGGLTDTELPLSVIREVWLDGLDQGGLSQRFLAGKVNFATLMPMRAIPFSRICLLGMNDGDYPRSQPPMDFDLMARDYRPGDRSRREDDRYLFLEALLSARDQLYISWIGRSINDNSVRPPSVLVAQLQDHLNLIRPIEGQGDDNRLSTRLTTEHPLQPFSPAYFSREANSQLFTYAREWRQAHDGAGDQGEKNPLGDIPADLVAEPLNLAALARFLRRPTDVFFSQRLGVQFDELRGAAEDEEPFVLDGLDNWALTDELVQEVVARPALDRSLAERLDDQLRHQADRGEFAQGGPGALQQRRLVKDLPELAERYHSLLDRYPQRLDLQLVTAEASRNETTVKLEDWLDDLRTDQSGLRAQIILMSSGLTNNRNQYKWSHFLKPWVRHLAASALGDGAVTTHVLSKAGDVTLHPLPAEQARSLLKDLLCAWLEALIQPLPVAPKTGFAWLARATRGELEKAESDARAAFDGGYQAVGESAEVASLGRAWPDFDSLFETGRFALWADRLYLPLWQNVKQEGEE